MRRAWFRSTVFNITFILVNALCCIIYLPTLLLPRRIYLWFIQLYHYIILALEYLILGLRYEVRGKEHLPSHGSYLVAAKHMSTYETIKLRLLFKDPSIILKKELLSIPLWGQFLKKTDIIAIDRSSPDAATKSIKDGALRMKAQGRPIVIFPQGTRVWPNDTPQEKRYKSGVYRMQAATDLTVVPMATNSGMFWPRSGWLKSSGTVTFKILPPIKPGMEKDDFMKHLEREVEEESLSLMNEAIMSDLDKKRSLLWPLMLLASLILGYSYLWFETAEVVKRGYSNFARELGRSTLIEEPKISGFPGPIKLDVLQESFNTPDGDLDVKIIHAQGWPIPFTPISLVTGPIEVKATTWPQSIIFDSFSAEFTAIGQDINIRESLLRKGDFQAQVKGTFDFRQKPFPLMDLTLSMRNQQSFLSALSRKGIIEKRMALFLGAGFSTLMDEDGIVRVPISQNGDRLFAGPLPIMQLPAPDVPIDPTRQEEFLPELPRLEPYSRLGPDQ